MGRGHSQPWVLQHHGVQLDVLDVVSVFADDPGKCRALDGRQLLCGEDSMFISWLHPLRCSNNYYTF